MERHGRTKAAAERAPSRADGGGTVNAARRPVQGRENVGRYVTGLVRRFSEGLLLAFVAVDGEAAVAFTDGGRLRGVLALHTDGVRLTSVDLVLNPEELVHAERQLSQMGGLPGVGGEDRP